MPRKSGFKKEDKYKNYPGPLKELV